MSPKIRTIVYIDGFNLYYGITSEYRGRYLWLGPENLTWNN